MHLRLLAPALAKATEVLLLSFFGGYPLICPCLHAGKRFLCASFLPFGFQGEKSLELGEGREPGAWHQVLQSGCSGITLQNALEGFRDTPDYQEIAL